MEVCLLDEVEQWILRLDERAYERVAEAIDLLERVGPGLGRPTVDTIEGSRHPNLKELRAGSVRVLFAFDPARQAVLLVAGDKVGLWSQWYRTAVPLADSAERETTMESKPKWMRWEDTKAKRPVSPEALQTAPQAREAEEAAYRLAEIRRSQQQTQAQIAAVMGVGQRRVSDIESAELLRTEVSTIDSYVAALGGRLRLIAEFGDQAIPLR